MELLVGHRVYPYLLRGLTIDGANQVWCSDITYQTPLVTLGDATKRRGITNDETLHQFGSLSIDRHLGEAPQFRKPGVCFEF